MLGIACGHAWIGLADAVVVYRDLGISPGMEKGIERATLELVPVEYRELPGWVAENPAPNREPGSPDPLPDMPGMGYSPWNPRAG